MSETKLFGNSSPKPAAPSAPKSMTPSIIGSDLNIVGNVVSNGEIQIEGEIQGDIHCSSLIVGKNAIITGGIISDDVVVRGAVKGSIRGSRVTLQSSGQVEGDIYHQSLAIEMGAVFDGKSAHVDNPMAMTGAGKQASGSKAPARGAKGVTASATTAAMHQSK